MIIEEVMILRERGHMGGGNKSNINIVLICESLKKYFSKVSAEPLQCELPWSWAPCEFHAGAHMQPVQPAKHPFWPFALVLTQILKHSGKACTLGFVCLLSFYL